MNKRLNDEVLVFLDLETTGLDPEHHQILEVGAIIVDRRQLTIVDEASWVIRPHWADVPRLKQMAGDYVTEMHEKSGLWNAVELTQLTMGDVGHEFPIWLKDNGLEIEGEQFTMAGNGLDRFDRPWLKFYGLQLGYIDSLFHYRSLDISNLSQAFKLAGHDVLKNLKREPTKHRAVDDCRQSLEDWAYLVGVLDDLMEISRGDNEERS